MKRLILLLVLLLSASFASAMGNPAAAYCEHMGYKLENEDCVFGNNKCNDWEFYRGECGQQYVRDIPCRKLGEAVFAGFEKCCEGGYTYAPKYLVGQSTCQPLSKIVIGNLKYNPIYWLLGVIILVIGYFIYKKVKK